MDDFSLAGDDHGYRSRRNSTSSPDDGHKTSSTLPTAGLYDTKRRIAHHVHKHHRSKSHDSTNMNSEEGSSSGGAGGSSGLQERILAKLMQQMLPSDYTLESYSEPRDRRRDKNRPQFALTTMSGNFRKFNARCALPLTAPWKERKSVLISRTTGLGWFSFSSIVYLDCCSGKNHHIRFLPWQFIPLFV